MAGIVNTGVSAVRLRFGGFSVPAGNAGQRLRGRSLSSSNKGEP
jgi:hypothetical protein